MFQDDSGMLLTYGFSADPSPVPVSTSQVTNQARVNISVSASQAVYCNQILVAVPVGDDQPSLYAAPPASSFNTNRWAVTSELKKGSELWEGLDADQSYSTFVFEAATPSDYLINYNLVFGVFGAVDSVTGVSMIAIQENTGTTSDPSTFTSKYAYFPVSKELPRFYLQNMVATTPSAPTVPATDFTNGAPIRLAWESNGTFFQVFQQNQTAPIYSGTATSFTLSGGVVRDTTFVLAASMTGSPGQDTPQGGYQPIYLYDSLTVTVSNPVLTPAGVAVAGTLSVAGVTSLATTGTGNLTAANATVTGALQAGSVATGGNLSASGTAVVGAAQVNGALAVSGGTTLSGATVNGTLNGTGSSQLSNLYVTGGLNAKSGPVSLIGGGVMLAQGTNIAQAGVLAQTDGFAVAQVLTPGDNGKSSFAYGSLYTVGTWFQVLGGTVGSFGSGWSDVMNNNPNAITIPVPANTYWYYSAGNPGGNQLDSPIQIWWFPMGSASSSGAQETFRHLTPDELAATAPPPPQIPDFSRMIERRAEAADEFVDTLARALGTELDDKSRAQLSKLLRRL